MNDDMNNRRNELLFEIVLEAEQGRTFIEMGRQGPKISVVSRDWKTEWCLREPDKSVPLIEELIPQLETAGPRARKCAEEGKKILARWERLKLGKQKPTEAELKWLARHVKIPKRTAAVLVGLHQAPRATIIALVYGTSKRPMHDRVNASDIEMMRMSRIVADLNQAIGRSAVRQMTPEGDVPEGCTVDLVASSWGPMGFKEPEDTLSAMFPGVTFKPWYPQISTAEPSKELLIVEAALSLLNGRLEASISTGEWATKAGYSPRTLQRYLRTQGIAGLLAARGVGVQKQGQKWGLKPIGDADHEIAA